MRLRDFQEITTIDPGLGAISPSGENYCVSTDLILERTGRRLKIPLTMEDGSSGPGEVASFSPDGRQLAWGTVGGVLYVAEIQEVCQRLSTLPGLKAVFKAKANANP